VKKNRWQTQRQAQRQTQRQAQRQTQRQAQRQTQRQTQRQAPRQTQARTHGVMGCCDAAGRAAMMVTLAVHVAAPSRAAQGGRCTAIVPAWQFAKNPDVRELFNLVAWLRNV
jgi:hypothetical protein